MRPSSTGSTTPGVDLHRSVLDACWTRLSRKGAVVTRCGRRRTTFC
jgi:hypothetical protein